MGRQTGVGPWGDPRETGHWCPWEIHKKPCIETPIFWCISFFSCGKPLVKKSISLSFLTHVWMMRCSEHGNTRHQQWNTTAWYHFELLIHPFILKFEYNSNSRWSPLTFNHLTWSGSSYLENLTNFGALLTPHQGWPLKGFPWLQLRHSRLL